MDSKLFYNRNAGKYDERHDTKRANYMRSVETLLLKKFAKGMTLDIGCGTGQNMGYATLGIDISAEMLKKAKKKGYENLVQARAEGLPFKNESFESVICMFTVLNLCDYEKAVIEMHRVLKKGGKAIVSTASIWDHSRKTLLTRLLSKRKSHVLRMRIEKFRFNFFAFTKDELIKLFCNFRLVRFYGIFIFANTHWGWKRDFAFHERLKLKIAFILDRFLQSFNHAARVYFAVFEKI